MSLIKLKVWPSLSAGPKMFSCRVGEKTEPRLHNAL